MRLSAIDNRQELTATRRWHPSGIARAERCAALVSGTGFGDLGRYSIFAAVPIGVFQATGSHWTLSAEWPGPRPPGGCGPLDALRFLVGASRSREPSDAVFSGGWIGFIGYDVAQLVEILPRRQPRAGTLPDIDLAYYDTFAIHDNLTGHLQFAWNNRFGPSQATLERRLARLNELLQSDISDDDAPIVAAAPESDFAPDEYCWAVERILEYIRAGDIFQANFAHRYSAPFCGSVEQLFARTLRCSPAPFAALIRGDDWAIVSTSPERFFRAQADGRVETRPIKGTRPRGSDPIHDLLLRAELWSSAKDRAELTMIVDLERNDLGRVCRYGSVQVARHAEIESFVNVHHLVSTVEGTLRPECDRVDLLRAMFPGGSITGAPKIRAMQIIDELERCRRGAYTGAIGYFSDNGRADFNIAIRTLVLDEGIVHYHVGGGIVADSDPLAEYRETLVKGRKLRQVLLAEA